MDKSKKMCMCIGIPIMGSAEDRDARRAECGCEECRNYTYAGLGALIHPPNTTLLNEEEMKSFMEYIRSDPKPTKALKELIFMSDDTFKTKEINVTL